MEQPTTNGNPPPGPAPAPGPGSAFAAPPPAEATTASPPLPPPPPTTTTDPDPSPWPAIEHNYFTSLRQVRESEDRALDLDFAARSDRLRHRLVGNYHAQADLLRRLQALRAEYDGVQAELDGAAAELATVRAARAAERAREDAEKKAWFETFRRGGLAYRGARVEGPDERVVAGYYGEKVSGGDGVERGAVENGVSGGVPARVDVREGDVGGMLRSNGVQREELERERSAAGTNGAAGTPGFEDRPPVEPASGESAETVRQAEASVSMAAREEPAPRAADEEMADAEPVTNGHGPERGEQEQAPSVERSVVDASAPAEERRDEQAEAKDKPETVIPTGEGQEVASPASEQEKTAGDGPTESLAPGDGEAMDGVEASRGVESTDIARKDISSDPVEPSMPEQRITPSEPIPDVEPSTEVPEQAVDAPQQVVEAPKQVVSNVEAQKGSDAAQAASAESHKDEPVGPTAEDVEMSDVPPPPSIETNDAELPQPAPPATPATPGPAAPAAAVAAPSPSSSSELSSRHTTPELDTPVSLGNEPSRPASPDTDRAVEVLDESGERLGLLGPLDINNTLVNRIRERPVVRPVQIRAGRKFSAEDLEAVPRPQDADTRAAKLLSFYIQAAGELQGRPCVDCAQSHGPFQGCVLVDYPDFPRCGNCEWSKRRCHGAALKSPASSRRSLPTASPESPSRTRGAGVSFTTTNSTSSKDENVAEGANVGNAVAPRKGPRKSLPTTRKAPPSTPAAESAQTEQLPEITKAGLALRDDGMVFTDPPIMRGVPLAKISPDHPYWEPEWKPVEEVVEPLMQKRQERFEQLEQSGSTHRDKHLANRDAKRGRVILKWLEEGELHPYQLVGKEWINHRIANYDTLFRLAHLLTEELPRMKLDVTPSQWVRQRIHEVYEEEGDKFDVARWVSKAYHDRKIEQLREKNGFPRVGRPPAHATKAEPGSTGSSKKPTVPRSLKRKDPHQTPDSTPSKPRMAPPLKTSPETSTSSVVAAAAAGQQKPKKIKIITTQPPATSEPSPASSTRGKPRIILNSPFPPSATTDDGQSGPTPSAAALDAALEYDGYTSTDSISGDRLYSNDWRLHQVKTRAFATNPHVTQYWHWVTGDEARGGRGGGGGGGSGGGRRDFLEHQVLESVRPIKWSLFKKPYNFHLRLSDIQEVTFARGCTKVIVAHRKGRDGRDVAPRGDVMAMFKRERTKKRFLRFLRKEKGVSVVEVSRERLESVWNSVSPETLHGPDSD